MAKTQVIDWQTMPHNPADAWRVIAEVAFPDFEVDMSALQRARDYCEKPTPT